MSRKHKKDQRNDIEEVEELEVKEEAESTNLGEIYTEEDGDIVQASSEEESLSDDSLTFSNGVIEKIVALAMRDVPGIIGMKGTWFNRVQNAFGVEDSTRGVSVEVTPESAVKVNISVLIEYGAYAPKVFEDAKEAVVSQIAQMTGLEVAGVNLRIEDVLTAEEAERRAARARREPDFDEEFFGIEPAQDEYEDAGETGE